MGLCSACYVRVILLIFVECTDNWMNEWILALNSLMTKISQHDKSYQTPKYKYKYQFVRSLDRSLQTTHIIFLMHKPISLKDSKCRSSRHKTVESELLPIGWGRMTDMPWRGQSCHMWAVLWSDSEPFPGCFTAEPRFCLLHVILWAKQYLRIKFFPTYICKGWFLAYEQPRILVVS